MRDALVVVWGGGQSKEWHYLRPNPPSLRCDLGTATPVGLGLALALPHRRVVILDTDGGILFNLSILSTLGNLSPPNLKVFVMDNESYESIGGAPTATAGATDLEGVARAVGIEHAMTTKTLEEFKETAQRALADNTLHFVVAKVEKSTRRLPTLYTDDIELKYQFVRYLEQTENIHVISASLQQIPEHFLK